jgi:signal transduction histidine kinase
MRLVDLHPPDQGERYMRMLGAWPGPTGTEPFIGEVVNASGDRIAAVISYVAFDDGEERRLHAIFTDLTASREAEHSIAEQRNRAEFYLDLMAHDVNNLSQGIVTAMELMKSNRQVPMNMVKYIELTLRLTGRITNIVTSVRRLSHLADAKMLLSRHDALDLLSVATRRVVRAYPHKDIHIDLPQPATQVLVMGNELLADVFTNILDNAVKFDRHVCIDIGVAVTSIGGGKAWRFEVRDQGPGVPDSMKERIFHRLDRTNVADRGSGLGLTFVDVVVRRLGGRVWVEDRVQGIPSKGSCFMVELPAAR